jgi:hypothetical protein
VSLVSVEPLDVVAGSSVVEPLVDGSVLDVSSSSSLPVLVDMPVLVDVALLVVGAGSVSVSVSPAPA